MLAPLVEEYLQLTTPFLQQSMQFLQLNFFVISIISFEDIIEKKFLTIELSKNRVESTLFA